MTCAPILAFGSEDLKQKYLKPLASGEYIGGFMLTEPDAGSDTRAMRTTATKVDGGWNLNYSYIGPTGTRRFVSAIGEDGPQPEP